MFNDDLSSKNRFKSYRFKQQNGDVISKNVEFTGRRDVSQKNKRQELELILVPSAFDQRNLGFQKLVVSPNWVGNTGPTGTPTSNESGFSPHLVDQIFPLIFSIPSLETRENFAT